MSGKTNLYKTGLACMRLQPLHIGHKRLIDKMLVECERVYIAIGSAQEEGTDRNPISYLNRRRSIESLYVEEWLSDKIRVVPAKDINDFPNWSTFVVNLIPDIIDKYYAGTEGDASAFKLYPPKNYPNIEIEILDREDFPVTATEIRKLFKQNNPAWKLHIPKGNIEITERILSGKHPFPELEKLEKEMGGEIL